MKLYHGTNTKNLSKILKSGLCPRGRRKSVWEQYPSRSDMVYLTTAYAPYFALNTDEKNRPVVLEIDASFLNENLFFPDEDFIVQALVHQDEGSMDDLHDEVRENLKGYQRYWQESIRGLGNCCYQGKIPAKAITRYCTWEMNDDTLYVNMIAMDPSINIMNYALMQDKYTGLIEWLFGDRDLIPINIPETAREEEMFKKQYDYNLKMSNNREHFQIVNL